MGVLISGRLGGIMLVGLSPGGNGRLRAPLFQRQPGVRHGIDKAAVLRQIVAKDGFDTATLSPVPAPPRCSGPPAESPAATDRGSESPALLINAADIAHPARDPHRQQAEVGAARDASARNPASSAAVSGCRPSQSAGAVLQRRVAVTVDESPA